MAGLLVQVRRRDSGRRGGHACAADLEIPLRCRQQLSSHAAMRACLCGSPGGAAAAWLSHSAGHA